VLPSQRAAPPGPAAGALPPQSLTASTTLNTQIFTNAGSLPQAGLGLLPKPLNVLPTAHAAPQHLQSRGGAAGGPGDFSGPRDHPFVNPRAQGGGGRFNSSPTRGSGGGALGSISKGADKSDRGAPRKNASSGAHREERRRDRSRELSKDMERSRASPPPPRKRSRSPVRTRSRSPRRSSPSRSRSPRSPPRRRARAGPRYSVAVPKMSLHFAESNVFDLRQRYSHM
jgi:hypothetical protein